RALVTLALGGERPDLKGARTHPVRDRLDRAPLSGAVTTLEDDADLHSLLLHPLLHLDELDVQLREPLFVFLAGQLALAFVPAPLRLLGGVGHGGIPFGSPAAPPLDAQLGQ